ncbi:hypothetical protein SZN_31714 [Streptomyces zinciresistens K42]|uniref:Uncharacterized protein n=1 Tax=Streptomyces zinciresistens K42 TaxID=700597 RepID=G2GLE7_9ACTN|nr:hypothetical protein SZN_31714 [Streptomyces zinciresistens K42]
MVSPGFGRPVEPERREAELAWFVGHMAADGWTQVHRTPGWVLLARTEPGRGGTAMGVGAAGVATGSAVGGVGLAGALAGIGMIVFGVFLTLTIIGAVVGIPMVMAGLAVFTGGTAAATAGGAVGAAGVAVGLRGAAARDEQVHLRAWADGTGRIFAEDA